MKVKVEIELGILRAMVDGVKRLPAEYFIGQELADLQKQLQKQAIKEAKKAKKQGEQK